MAAPDWSPSRPWPPPRIAASLKGVLRATRLLLLAALVSLGWDQLTKQLVYRGLAPGDSWIPFPAAPHAFAISHVPNSGAAFGVLPGGNMVFLLIALIVPAAILYYHRRIAQGEPKLQLALGLVVGGALGNGLDRLLYGYVVDFIDFHIWPIFNFADVAIVAGVMLLAFNGDTERPGRAEADTERPVRPGEQAESPARPDGEATEPAPS